MNFSVARSNYTWSPLTTTVFKDYLEAFAILVVILITVAIGFFMELSAVNSLEKLRKLSETKARVIRDGNIISLRTVFLVPGDILLIESGNIVPADARLIEVDHLMVKEAILTGESVPIEKNTGPLPETTPTADQTNMIFNGTTVTSGMGKAIIVSTGANTQLGIIHQIGSGVTQNQTPLEKKLNKLSSHLIWLTLFFCIVIVVLGYLRGQELILMIQIGIALAVASIPEGLPIVATIALAQGMLRLSKKDIIIKNLEAVQTLGATTIICTDKTGTLTEDQMKVHHMVLEGEYIEDLFQKELHDFDTPGRKTGFETLMKAIIEEKNFEAKILCIGDKGRWPGNDFALLSTRYSLSVDSVSYSPTCCWNLAPVGIRGTQATEYYLSKIKKATGQITLELNHKIGA